MKCFKHDLFFSFQAGEKPKQIVKISTTKLRKQIMHLSLQMSIQKAEILLKHHSSTCKTFGNLSTGAGEI